MPMEIKTFCNSLFSSASYLVDGRVLVDCGDWYPEYAKVVAVLLTHGHFDHMYGMNRLVDMNPSVKIFTNIDGWEALLSDKKNMSRYHETPFVFEHSEKIKIVTDDEVVQISDKLSATAHFTPGHNPGCITWVIEDFVFTGDSYIPGIKTVTNLPGSDKALAAQSELLIKKLAEGKRIFPGHKIEADE